jgi:hypothetical protein
VSTDQIMKSAEELSSMADKVAGFGISANLILIFACLKKDISSWVQSQPKAFMIGTCVAGLLYITAVWVLHYGESYVLGAAEPPGGPPLLVSLWLAWARTLGIAVFTAIGMLVVWGASKPR